MPLALGGPRTDRRNLQGMCGPHNFSKGSRMVTLAELAGDVLPKKLERALLEFFDPPCEYHLQPEPGCPHGV